MLDRGKNAGGHTLILVTGATGFVGSYVGRALAAEGLAVRRASRQAIPGQVVIGPLSAVTDWRPALAGCDAVVHLAAVVHSRDVPEAGIHEANVAGTVQLAREAVRSGVRRLVFLSTVKVMGESTVPGRPFREADPPAPEDAYARSKLAAERGLAEVADDTGLEVVIIRPPLLHGPGVKANLRALLEAVDRGAPLPLGAVHNRRSMLGLANLSALIRLVLEHPAAAGQIFLAADATAPSTTDLLEAMARHLERPSRLLPVSARLVEAGLRLAGRGGLATRLLGSLEVDTTRARELLGFVPQVSFDEGIAEMVAAWRRFPSAP